MTDRIHKGCLVRPVSPLAGPTMWVVAVTTDVRRPRIEVAEVLWWMPDSGWNRDELPLEMLDVLFTEDHLTKLRSHPGYAPGEFVPVMPVHQANPAFPGNALPDDIGTQQQDQRSK